MSFGIEDAGLKLGRDADVVSKQSSDLLHLFRRELLVVNENFRLPALSSPARC